MRHENNANSPYIGMYTNLASWLNQPHLAKKMSFRQYSIERGMKYEVYKQYKNNYKQYIKDGYSKGASWRYAEEFEKIYPEIAKEYYDMRFEDLNMF